MTQISEKKRIIVKRPSDTLNNIFLMWFNARCGVERMLFEAKHGVTRVTGDSVSVEKYVENLITGETFEELVRKNSFKELELTFKDADIQTRNGLQSILYSPRVKMLMNPLEWDLGAGYEPIFNQVRVLDGSADVGDSDEKLYDFKFTIAIPETQTLKS